MFCGSRSLLMSMPTDKVTAVKPTELSPFKHEGICHALDLPTFHVRYHSKNLRSQQEDTASRLGTEEPSDLQCEDTGEEFNSDGVDLHSNEFSTISDHSSKARDKLPWGKNEEESLRKGNGLWRCSKLISSHFLPEQAPSRTENKFESILKFLDEEETDAADTGEKTGQRKPASKGGPACEDYLLTKEGSSDSKRCYGDDCFEFLDNQESELLSLRLALSKEREKSSVAVQEAEEGAKKKLKQQKELLENRIKNLQHQIDQVNEEKKIFRDRCDTIAADIKNLQIKHEKKLEENEKRHQEEFKRAKAQWQITEKARYQKWITDKAQKIKEATLKTVEPEIQHIIDLHKDEMRQVQESFDELKRQAVEAAHGKRHCEIAALEEAVVQRIADIRQQERQLAEHIYRDQIECVESDFRVHLAKKEEQIRTNLEVYEQRSKIQSEEICRIRMEAELDRAEAVKAERTIAMEERAVLEKQHTTEVKRLIAQNDVNFNEWKVNASRDQEIILTRKLQESTSILKGERDMELGRAMASMAEEMTNVQTDLQKTSDIRIARFQERYQQEIAELQDSLEMWKKTTAEAKERADAYCGKLDEHQRMQKESQQRLSGALEKTEALEKERNTIVEDVAATYKERLMNMDAQIDRLTRDLREKENHYLHENKLLQTQIELLKAENDSELETIKQKIQLMLAKKDSKIEMLRKQLLATHQSPLPEQFISQKKTPVQTQRSCSTKTARVHFAPIVPKSRSAQ